MLNSLSLNQENIKYILKTISQFTVTLGYSSAPADSKLRPATAVPVKYFPTGTSRNELTYVKYEEAT